MKTSRMLGLVAAVALTIGGAGAAGAAGSLKGTFGGVKFKGFKKIVTCEYVQSTGFFQITGTSRPKVHISSRTADIRWTQMGGVAGADPTAPGAAFPIVITETEGAFVNAEGVGLGTDPSSIPGWVTQSGDTFTITLTGYKKGKIVGTFSGSMSPGKNTSGAPIDTNGKFAAKCILQ